MGKEAFLLSLFLSRMPAGRGRPRATDTGHGHHKKDAHQGTSNGPASCHCKLIAPEPRIARAPNLSHKIGPGVHLMP